MSMSKRFATLALPWLVIGLAGAMSLAQSTERALNTIGNGTFEDSVQSTYDPAEIFAGGYWNNAEGKVHFITTGAGTTQALRLQGTSDHVIQRFSAFEYIAQGASEGYTDTMTISGQVLLTDLDVEARLVVEEAPLAFTGASWGLRDPNNSSLAGDWIYKTYDAGTQTYSDMQFVDLPGEVNDYYKGAADASARVHLNYQIAGYSRSSSYEATVRAWVASEDGWIQIQTRAARHPHEASPEKTTPGSDVELRITVHDDATSMALDRTLGTFSIDDSDGVVFSERIYVEEGQVLAFETSEEGAPLSTEGFRSARVQLDPVIYYDPRRVVYRFGDQLGSATSDDDTLYPSPIQVSQVDTWQSFTLNVGSDYAAHFATVDGFSHGPVPQLAVRLELADGGASGDAWFDDIANSVKFYYPSRTSLDEAIRDELDRIIENWFEYGILDDDNGTPFYHAQVRRRFDAVDGSPLGNLVDVGYLGSFEDLVRDYSGHYYHELATPWLFYEIDAIVRHRDPDFGFERRYDFTAQHFTDWPDGKILDLGSDAIMAIEMYDATGDVTYLDMAYECGVSILENGEHASTGLYTTRFEYDTTPATPELVPQFSSLGSPVGWSRGTYVLAHIAGRIGATPALSSRYGDPDADDFLTEAKEASNWVATEAPTHPQGYWDAYWLDIEREMDDFLGYNSAFLGMAYEETGDDDFLDDVAVGSAIFYPEWIQTFDRSTLMNGDQERAWDAYLHLFRDNPDPSATESKWEYGRAYVEALLYQMRGGQLGNGVWTASNIHHAQFPGLVGSGAPLTPADTHKLRPLIRAFADDDLDTYGITDGTYVDREDLYAIYASAFTLNQRHYGEFIAGTNQVAYMDIPAFPDPNVGTPTIQAGYELRALASAPLMLAAIEDEVNDAIGNDRPVVDITPGNFGYTSPTNPTTMRFTVTDADGLSDLIDSGIVVRITETDVSSGGVTEYLLVYDPDNPAAPFEEVSNDSETVTFEWASGYLPYLAADKNYRFSLSAIDDDRRWDYVSVLYEIRN